MRKEGEDDGARAENTLSLLARGATMNRWDKGELIGRGRSGPQGWAARGTTRQHAMPLAWRAGSLRGQHAGPPPHQGIIGRAQHRGARSRMLASFGQIPLILASQPYRIWPDAAPLSRSPRVQCTLTTSPPTSTPIFLSFVRTALNIAFSPPHPLLPRSVWFPPPACRSSALTTPRCHHRRSASL